VVGNQVFDAQPWNDMMCSWLDEVWTADEYCTQHNVQAFVDKRQAWQTSLARCAHSTIVAKVRAEGLAVNVKLLPKSLDIYPSDRASATDLVLAAFDAKWPEAKVASTIIANTESYVESRLLVKLGRPLPDAGGQPTAASTEEKLGAPNVAMSQESANDIMSIIQANEKAELESASDNISNRARRDVIIAVQAYFDKLIPAGLPATSTLDVYADRTNNEDDTKKQHLVIMRKSVEVPPAAKEAHCKGMPFWGTVVTEASGETIASGCSLRLGDNAGAGPALVLDGTKWLNAKSSVACTPFIVPVYKPPKAEEGGTAASPEAWLI
jgi:hypothetical protein